MFHSTLLFTYPSIVVLPHWGGHQRVEGREEDQKPLGEGLSKEREARQGGRAGIWPRQWHTTGGLGGQCDGLMRLLAQRAMMMMMMMMMTDNYCNKQLQNSFSVN